jgi:hypothetical protein
MTNDLTRLLAAERAVMPPAQAAEAGLERLLTALAAHAAPLPVAVGSLKLGGSLVAKWIGVGFAVGIVGAGTAAQVWAPPSPVAAPSAALVAPATGSASLPAFGEAPVAVPSAEPEAPMPQVASAPPSSRAEAAPSASPTFDEELRLITRAKQELDAGRPHLAQVWLDEHQQRFPGGVFALDREGLSILTRCSQRQNPALARDFAARHPGSPMVGQLQRKCGVEASLGAPRREVAAPAGSPTSAGDFSESDK